MANIRKLITPLNFIANRLLFNYQNLSKQNLWQVRQYNRHLEDRENNVEIDLYTDASQYNDTCCEKEVRIIFDPNNKYQPLYSQQFEPFIRKYIDYVYTYPNINRELKLYKQNKAISTSTLRMFKHINIACSNKYFIKHENGILVKNIPAQEKNIICDIINLEINELNSAVKHLKTLEFINKKDTNRKILVTSAIVLPTFNYLVPGVWNPIEQMVEWFGLITGIIIFHEIFYPYNTESDIVLFTTAKRNLTCALLDKITRLQKLHNNIIMNAH